MYIVYWFLISKHVKLLCLFYMFFFFQIHFKFTLNYYALYSERKPHLPQECLLSHLFTNFVIFGTSREVRAKKVLSVYK